MTAVTGDTRYNPLPGRVAVPLYPVPRPGAGFVAAVARGLRSPSAVVEDARRRLAALLAVTPERITFTDSGMAALVLALRALRRSATDEVLLATFACPRLLDAVLAADMVPVLCDVDDSGNIDVDDVRRRMTCNARAVVAGHTFGAAADLIALTELCQTAGVHLIDDAAQALGTRHLGRALGAWGSFGVLSFGRHKPFYAGGGGAIVRNADPSVRAPRTPDGSTAGLGLLARAGAVDALRALSSGLPRRLGLQPSPQSDVVAVLESGDSRADTGSGLPWVSAAFLADQLAQGDANRRRQRRHLARIRAVVDSRPGLDFPALADDMGVNFLALRCPPRARHQIAAQLAHNGVETTWLYYPLHRVRRYVGRVVCEGPFPRAEHLWRRTLCVPCRGWHTDRQIDRLVTALFGVELVRGGAA
ncbi:aminotransferase class V-fold PLP-dependent enzyme [Streptomyces massasporeus]|uniref:aminotransferase class V-fold PLP-dependent enzyme n=1 Tax=Streptomyces massasporeus TaxID=67324 RepID=UPI0036688BFA